MNERKAVKYHDRLVALARKLEWAAEDSGRHYCPSCGSLEGLDRHMKKCELAALLREIDREP